MFYLPGDSVISMTPAKVTIVLGVAVVGLYAMVAISDLMSGSGAVKLPDQLIPENQQPFYESGMSAEGAETEVLCEFVPYQGVKEFRIICPPVVRIEIIDVRPDNPPVGDPYQFDFREPDQATPSRNRRFVK